MAQLFDANGNPIDPNQLPVPAEPNFPIGPIAAPSAPQAQTPVAQPQAAPQEPSENKLGLFFAGLGSGLRGGDPSATIENIRKRNEEAPIKKLQAEQMQRDATRLKNESDPNHPMSKTWQNIIKSTFPEIGNAVEGRSAAEIKDMMGGNLATVLERKNAHELRMAIQEESNREKQSKQDEIQRQKDEAELVKTKDQAMGLARMGNGPFRIASVNLYRAANGERILKGIASGELKGTDPEVSEIAGDIDAIVSAGGASSVQRLNHFKQQTGLDTFSKLLTFATNNPQSSISKEMLDEYSKVLGGQKETALHQLDKSMGGQGQKLKYIFERGSKRGQDYEGDWRSFLQQIYPELQPAQPVNLQNAPQNFAPTANQTPSPASQTVKTSSGFTLKVK